MPWRAYSPLAACFPTAWSPIAKILMCTVALATHAAYSQTNPACGGVSFDPKPWLEDFGQLRSEMSSHYANLEYAVKDRRMDLPALRRETEEKLSTSCSEADARKAMEAFLSAFGDGHLELDWPKPESGTAQDKAAETGSLCVRLGYKKFGFKPGIEFSALPGFTAIGGEGADWFPGGILRASDSVRLGVIRIAILSEHAYPEACEQTTAALKLAPTAKCDEQCENDVERETANRLTDEIVHRAEQLRASGATAILVDITRNGGGSNWAEAPPRALSSVPLMEAHAEFIRHEHWTKQLQDHLAEVEADLKSGAEPTGVLQDAAARLRSGIAQSQQPCDRSQVWVNEQFSCSLLVDGALFDAGLRYAAPGSFASWKSRTLLFDPLRYKYSESGGRLPLVVAVDANTWSAAEYFAAVLQDNQAATIVGTVTGGAGCGYTDGGIPTTLKNSHAAVKMPDCVRLRRNGMNEAAGVTPDVLIPWSAHDSPAIKAEKLLESLKSLPISKASQIH
jgi:peptidase S41-like protein